MDVQDQLIKCTIEDMDTPKARKGQLLPDEFDVDAYNVSACLFHTLEDRVPHTQEHDPSWNRRLTHVSTSSNTLDSLTVLMPATHVHFFKCSGHW